MFNSVFEYTFPQGLVTQAGQLLAVHRSVSVGWLILSQAVVVRILTAPLASSYWQDTCLWFQPPPHEAEHFDHSDTTIWNDDMKQDIQVSTWELAVLICFIRTQQCVLYIRNVVNKIQARGECDWMSVCLHAQLSQITAIVRLCYSIRQL